MPTTQFAEIPNLVKHCTVAIFRSGDIKGSTLEKFRSCYSIAKARLTQYGFLSSGAGDPPLLTRKGFVRERQHSREGGHKSAFFDKLYAMLQAKSRPKAGQAADEGRDEVRDEDKTLGRKPSEG